MNPWIYLLLAGIFEVGFTTCMRLSDGFRRWEYLIPFSICAICSFGLLTLSARSISLGLAYAVWTGMGAAGTLLVSRVFFKDSISLPQTAFILLIIVSVIGLKYSSNTQPSEPVTVVENKS